MNWSCFVAVLIACFSFSNCKDFRRHIRVDFEEQDDEGKDISAGKLDWRIVDIKPENCFDSWHGCKDLASKGKCLDKFDTAIRKCSWSCRLCKKSGHDSKKCSDLADNCQSWVDKGDCIRYPDYMTQNCKKACGMCGSETSRFDTDPRCADWSKSGFCTTTKKISMNCQYSCKKYHKVAAASKAFPEPIRALHPLQMEPKLLNPERSHSSKHLSSKHQVESKKKYNTQECSDLGGVMCKTSAQQGNCLSSPDNMFLNCKMSCELCEPGNNKFDEDVRCPFWGKNGYCKINAQINNFCVYSCDKYKNAPAASQPNPYQLAQTPTQPMTQPGQTTPKPGQTTPKPGETTAKPEVQPTQPQQTQPPQQQTQPPQQQTQAPQQQTQPPQQQNQQLSGVQPAEAPTGDQGKAKKKKRKHGKILDKSLEHSIDWKSIDIAPEDCKDQYGVDCEDFVASGKCLKKVKKALKTCPLSCRFCSQTTEYSKDTCEDLSSDCIGWAKKGDCLKLPDYMLYNCRKSCKLCGKGMTYDQLECTLYIREKSTN